MATGGEYSPGSRYRISSEDAPVLSLLRGLPDPGDDTGAGWSLALNGGVDNGAGSRKAAATWFHTDVANYRRACALGGIPDDQKLSDSTQGAERR